MGGLYLAYRIDNKNNWRGFVKSNKELIEFFGLIAAVAVLVAQLWANSMTREAIDFSKKSAHLDQRAWIGIKEVGIMPIAPGQPLQFFGTIFNSGRTAATNIRLLSFSGVVRSANPIILESELEANSDKIYQLFKSLKDKDHLNIPNVATVIFPDNFSPVTIPSPYSLTTEELEDISAKKEYVYLISEINYSDIFGERHRTTSFFRYNSGTKLMEWVGAHSFVD
jgi:hypothetical protein